MSLNTLNESLDIIANLVIPRLEDDVDVIQKLDDEPNDVGGLTAAELKAKFDEAANIIKTYLNETLVPQLSDTVAEAEVRAQAESERIANEMARVEGENLREEAEVARVQAEEGRVVSEQTRQTDENGRKTSETNRISAESTRQTNEQQRQSQESTRQANEETRQSQEITRQTNEQTRQNQEQARQTAEVLRATEEQERKTAEAQRANAETIRQTDEQTRQSNEQARKTAEDKREANEQSRKNSFDEEIKQAKSWAVGGTGVRDGEDTNNAKYWSEQAKANVGGDFATNARVDEVEDEVGRVAQSVTTLETKVEQDVGQAIQGVNQTISGLQTRVQPINLGGTGATTAAQAIANLGAAPAYTYGTEDLTAGASPLETGKLHFVYE